MSAHTAATAAGLYVSWRAARGSVAQGRVVAAAAVSDDPAAMVVPVSVVLVGHTSSTQDTAESLLFTHSLVLIRQLDCAWEKSEDMSNNAGYGQNK